MVKKLISPVEVRWSTVCNSIRSYFSNRGILVQICQDHKSEMEKEICKLVNDQKLVEEAEEFIKIMIPISIALARAQRDSSTIAIMDEIWYKLEQDLKHESSYVLKHFHSR